MKRIGGLLAAICLLTLVFVPAAALRLVDGDEGYYLLASKLVMQGKTLYHDFLFPQMPLLPYVYGIWMKLAGFTWHSARLFSALLAAASGMLLYFCASSISQRKGAGLLAVFLFASSCLTLEWLTTAKTYSLSVLLLLSAYAALRLPPGRLSRRRMFLCGLLMGLAIDTRLLLAAAAPAFLLDTAQNGQGGRNREEQALPFLGGLALALAPNLYFLICCPENYFFNNLGYHALRSGAGLIGDMRQKAAALAELLGFRPGTIFSGVQITLLAAGAAGRALAAFARRRWPLSLAIAVLLAAASFLPTPTYPQYFSVLVPFGILNCVEAIDRALPWLSRRRAATRRIAVFVFVGLLALYACAAPAALYRLTVSGRAVSGIKGVEDVVNWRIATINRIAAVIDRNTTRNEPVLCFWPGYLIESQAAALPKTENQFGLELSPGLSPSQLERRRIISVPEIRGHLARRDVRLVILGNWSWRTLFQNEFLFNRYTRIQVIGSAEIYLLNKQ